MSASTRHPADPALPIDPVTDVMGWQRLATGAWGREPTRLAATPPGRLPVDPQLGFAAIHTASAPFRAGTRVRAVPDVRFFTTTGRIRAPATLLPGPEDLDIHHYLERVCDSTGECGWLLVVEHPLIVDARLWSTVRDLVSDLWRRVGWPALPVTAELAAGHGYTRTDGLGLPSEAAGLLWVLAGRLTVRLWREPAAPTGPALASPDRELAGTTGDLLYWPATFRVAELFTERCLTLKLSVGGSYRRAAVAAKNLLIDRAQRTPAYADGEVPYLPYPPPVAPDGATATAERVQATGSLVHRLVAGPELARALRHQWAARRSAAGLEPVPAPLAESTLDHDDRLRAGAEIVRLPDGAGRTIWAVNGHLLPVAGAAADRIRAALTVGAETSVPQLCQAAGAGERNQQVLDLLRTLHRLRAIQPVPADGAPP